MKDHIFAEDAYVFRGHPGHMQILRQHLSGLLQLSPPNITIVGSAKMGFSLSPQNFPRSFSRESDIDVLIVDESLFDTFWHTLLGWNYPRRHKLPEPDWQWMIQRRNELYWGWFVPDRIHFAGLSFPHFLKPLRDASTAWFNAFRSLAQYPEFAGRDVSGRLYRTWEHARLYHTDGLRQIREMLQQSRTEGT